MNLRVPSLRPRGQLSIRVTRSGGTTPCRSDLCLCQEPLASLESLFPRQLCHLPTCPQPGSESHSAKHSERPPQHAEWMLPSSGSPLRTTPPTDSSTPRRAMVTTVPPPSRQEGESSIGCASAVFPRAHPAQSCWEAKGTPPDQGDSVPPGTPCPSTQGRMDLPSICWIRFAFKHFLRPALSRVMCPEKWRVQNRHIAKSLSPGSQTRA